MSENENCLAGLKCPKCGALEPFRASTLSVAIWTDDGVEDHVEPEIYEDFLMDCLTCGARLPVKAFKTENQ